MFTKVGAANIRKQMPLSTYCCAHIHDCTATEPGKRQWGSSKKKKIICTNLVYFQSIITMTFHLPLTHIALFPGVFLLLMDRWCNDSALSQNQNIHTTVSVHIQYGLPWWPALMCIRLSFWVKNRPHSVAAYMAELVLVTLATASASLNINWHFGFKKKKKNQYKHKAESTKSINHIHQSLIHSVRPDFIWKYMIKIKWDSHITGTTRSCSHYWVHNWKLRDVCFVLYGVLQAGQKQFVLSHL